MASMLGLKGALHWGGCVAQAPAEKARRRACPRGSGGRLHMHRSVAHLDAAPPAEGHPHARGAARAALGAAVAPLAQVVWVFALRRRHVGAAPGLMCCSHR